MRRALLSFAFAPLAFAALSSGANAQTTEPNTYRPGQVYTAQPVPVVEACASQCNGDAACQGWNYLPYTESRGGLCELNAQSVSPIPHRTAISGMAYFAKEPGSVIATTSKMKVNTRRIGTPYVAPKPRAAQPRPQVQRGVQRQVQRQIQRQIAPVPQANPNMRNTVQRNTIQRNTFQGQPLQRQRAPQRPVQYAPPQNSPLQSRQQNRQQARPQQAQLRAPNPQQALRAPAQAPTQANAPQAPALSYQPLRAPNRAAPQRPLAAPQQQRPLQAPRTQALRTQAPRPAMPQDPPRRTLRTMADFETSLFGNLRDDERPEEKRAPIPSDPNAPISTFAIAAPSGTVEQKPLPPFMPGPQLAGAPQKALEKALPPQR